MNSSVRGQVKSYGQIDSMENVRTLHRECKGIAFLRCARTGRFKFIPRLETTVTDDCWKVERVLYGVR